MKKCIKKKRIAIIIFSLFLILLIILCLCIISSKADISKQQGGIPGSTQIYEYYSFSGQSNKLYNKILSSKYNYNSNELDINNEAYMVLSIDNKLNVLPDNYLYSNYTSFNVKCDVLENNYHQLKLKYSGEGTSVNNQKMNIDFSLIVDWQQVYLHSDNCVYISIENE